MDNVSCMECLKLDSQSELLDKEGSEKDIFLPAIVPLNGNTPMIDSKVEEPKTTELMHEDEVLTDEDEELTAELEAFALHWVPPSPTETKVVESEAVQSEGEESKGEESEDEESEGEESEDKELTAEERRSYIGECKYCLKVGEHITQICPYIYNVPKNATLGKGCELICKFCGCQFIGSCCANCGLSEGCAILKDCQICAKQGEHWPSTCPKRKGKHIPSSFTCSDYTGHFSFNINREYRVTATLELKQKVEED